MEVTIRQAESCNLEALSILATETYSAAFGHSLSVEDLRLHVEQELSSQAFAYVLVTEVILIRVASGAETSPDIIMLRRS